MTVIQDLIDRARPGDTVRIPPGIYTVDAVNESINMRSDITLDLSAGAILQAAPISRRGVYQIILARGCKRAAIVGGTIRGERNTNPDNANWERGDVMGHGIHIREGSNIKIQNTVITDCMGDGILIWHNEDGAAELDHVTCDHNRRQGASFVDASNIHVHDSQFSNNGGTPPGCGIDVENDTDAETCTNILIERCVFSGNAGSSISIGSPGKYVNCRVPPTNDFDMVTQPIWAAGGAAPLGTPWWAFLLNRTLGWLPGYRWWGYPTEWYH